MTEPVDFCSLSRAELEQLLSERLGMPSFRAAQLFQWIYKRRLTDWEAMTDFSKAARQQLAQLFVLPQPSQASRQISKDGTRKYLFELSDSARVETVMIKQPKRMTLCVSSQVGCALKCAFCRTGTMGLKRHLTTSEILTQVLGVVDDAKQFGDMFSNMVFMGMGEPLHNYDNVVRALQILTDDHGLAIPPRRITVSSAGLVPAIKKFGSSGLDVSLAISLNATNNEVRSKVMPINNRYPLEELIQTLRELPLKPRQSITLEYVLLGGVNDSAADLARLPKLIHGLPAKMNLIPYNTNAGLGFYAPKLETVDTWMRELNRRGVVTTVRWSKGQDIDAACGQLATILPTRKAA